MNYFSTLFIVLTIYTFFILGSCKDVTPPPNEITPEDDKVIGQTLDEEIIAHTKAQSNIELLEQADNTSAYAYLDKIIDKINNSTNFIGLCAAPNTSTSPITIRIISKNDNTGAFILPGGYIYLYSDLLKTINTEAQIIAVLSHLMACSEKRYTNRKLQERFSLSFMIDLALGSGLNASNSVDITTILSELEDVPYSESIVADLDIEAEHTVCELSYDIKSYSDLFNRTKSLKWYLQFPRPSNDIYSSDLSNTIKETALCILGEVDGQHEYSAFKSLLP